MGEAKRVLQIGGIAGLLAGVLFLVSAILDLALLPPFATVEEFLMGFGSRAATVALLQGLTLLAIILAIALFAALYAILKETSPAYALTGLVLFVVGIALTALSLGGFLVAPGQASVYTDPMTTDEERVALAQVARVVGLLISQLGFMGSLFAILAILALGAVMLGNSNFGRGYGALAVLLGLLGLVLTIINLALPIFIPAAVVAVPLLFVFGWKVYSLSRAA